MNNLKKIAFITAISYTPLFIALIPSYTSAKTNHKNDTTKKSFVVTDAYDKSIDISLQKNKVLFINFWSLTCVPCKAEMPTINNLANHYKNDTNFLVIPIDLDRNLAEDIRYFNEKNLTLTVYKSSGIVPEDLFMGVLPTTAVIDKKGKIVFFRQEEGKYDIPSFFHFADSLLGQ
jgi:thiol-disulfide isomerase/thioredoxin